MIGSSSKRQIYPAEIPFLDKQHFEIPELSFRFKASAASLWEEYFLTSVPSKSSVIPV